MAKGLNSDLLKRASVKKAITKIKKEKTPPELTKTKSKRASDKTLTKKTAKQPAGVSAQTLIRNTPPHQVELSKDVRLLRKTLSTTSFGWPEAYCITKSLEPTTAAKPPKLQCVVRLNPATKDHLWIYCSCEDFTYRLEYALTQYRASSIQQSNGDPALIKNPRNVPSCCKHIFYLIHHKSVLKQLQSLRDKNGRIK